MPLKAFTPRNLWEPAQKLYVYDATGTWRPVLSVKRTNGAGNWTTVWPMVPHFHEVVSSGGDIQAAMERATAWFTANKTIPVNFDDELTMACVELVPGGLYNIGTNPLLYRRGVRLMGNGATITGNGTHIFKGDNNGGGQYNSPNRDWMIKDVTFDSKNTAGGLSSSHVYRYRLDGVTIKNIGGRKHHVEINSSGGPVGSAYNVEILNCTFFQESVSSGVRTEDEAIQLDYSWDGAAPGVANDGTVTNNVLIRGCTFYQLPRAIGGHSYNSQPTWAAGIHSHVLIEGCTFTDINTMIWGDGDPNAATSEGAVRVYYWANVVIQDNLFKSCFQPIMVYSPDDSAGAIYPMGQTSILRNTFEDCGGEAGRHAAYGGSAGAGNSIGRVLFEYNVLTGTWGGGSTGYFAGFDDTSGTLPNSAYSVVIRYNRFEPSNYDLEQERLYNKYRSGNSTNNPGVYIQYNTISDGSVENT
jgi:hypothetical protein